MGCSKVKNFKVAAELGMVLAARICAAGLSSLSLQVLRDDHQAAIAKLLGQKLQFVIADSYQDTLELQSTLRGGSGRLTAYAPDTKRHSWSRLSFPNDQTLPRNFRCSYAVNYNKTDW